MEDFKEKLLQSLNRIVNDVKECNDPENLGIFISVRVPTPSGTKNTNLFAGEKTAIAHSIYCSLGKDENVEQIFNAAFETYREIPRK